MKLIGLMHVRNEQWILGLALPAALRLVDELVILDHASTDATPEIIDRCAKGHPGRLHAGAWSGRHYNETAIRQELLETGRLYGGTHFFMIDADEVLSANLIDPVRYAVADLEPGEGLELPWLAMWQSADRYRADSSVWSNNSKLFAYADGPGVTHRALDDGYDMHQQAPRKLVKPYKQPWQDADGGVMHLQFANRRRLIAKHAWYKMSELIRFPGRESAEAIDAKYNQALDDTGLRTAEVPESWWKPYGQLRAHIDLGDAPWHESEVRRFWLEHGPGFFAGLDLWGLPERLTQQEAAA